MDKTLKIVFSSLTVFLLTGFQNLYSKGQFLVPYELNTVILILVGLLVFIFSLRNSAIKNNAIYFIGILAYGIGDQRFLEFINYKTGLGVIQTLINSPYTYLVSIVIFYSLLIYIYASSYNLKNKLQLLLFLLLILSFVTAMLNFTIVTMVLFSVFVLASLIAMHWKFNNELYQKINGVSYQLFVLIIFENTYFFIS
jgi:hypothetical protein